MEQPAADEHAQHGDQIEITEPGRIDFGKRFQVESSGVESVQVLDNRIRVYVFHTDYKVVKRCGKPASEAPKKKVGRPSNAEREARIAEQVAACAVKPSVVAPKAPVVTKAELEALEKAIDVPVVRKTVVVPGKQGGKTIVSQLNPKAAEEVLHSLAKGLGMLKPDTDAKAGAFTEQVRASHSFPALSDLVKRSPIAELEGVNAEHPDTPVVGNGETGQRAQVGDVIKITGGTHVAKHDAGHESKYKPGTELQVTGSGTDVVNAREIGYSPLKWNFVVNHGDYEIVSTASQEKALKHVTVGSDPLITATAARRIAERAGIRNSELDNAHNMKLTQEQFDAMTRQDPVHIGMDFAMPGSDTTVVSVVKQAPKHSHYFKPCPFDHVDVYRVLNLFGVVDPCLQHAVKKLLVAGGRRHKDIATDVQDSIDTLERWKAMRAEEQAAA